jgi:sialic acid synthase SpsE/mannose-6-phosphate isomerase-like protein (cupin superfamily)
MITDIDFDFEGLVVLDLANNHQSSVDHGKAVIRAAAEAMRKHGVRAAMKFQFRQLDSFIHPAHRKQSDNKYVARFLSTELKRADFQQLLDAVREEKLLAMCTPFDEASVAIICDMGFDILKVASCSATDWPLLEAVADAGLPVVCSTGGLALNQVDDLVSFFDHRGVRFALMYCVSIYPTPPSSINLNMIEIMRLRYPDVTIGWSTHEDPNDTAPVHMAVAKGAGMFERHVGLETDKIKLNGYSSTPEQLDRWMAAYRHAQAICGSETERAVEAVEGDSLILLARGIFAKKPIKKGAVLKRDQVYFAMPQADGSLASGQWRDGIVATVDIKADAPLLNRQVEVPAEPDYMVVKSALHDVKALLNQASVVLNSAFDVEYSHHYGIRNFREFGAVIINCINREYCKKIIVQLPGQRHPSHYHKRKEETFQVLSGQLHVNVDGHIRTLDPGETLLVQPGVWHSFWTDGGCVFEEVSTTHYNDDSYYADKKINKMARPERKTIVDHWGRFELTGESGAARQS